MSNITILGDEFDQYNVLPSDKMYFKRFAYKVELNNDGLDTHRKIIHFRRQLEDFEMNCLSAKLRQHVSSTGVNVYLKNIDDLRSTVAMFSSQVNSISGPLNKEHYDVLSNKDCYISLRKNLWYGQYDCRIFFSNFSRFKQPISTADAYLWLKENLTNTKTKLFLDRDEYIYFDYAEFIDILPFFKLQFGDMRIILTKCILK